MLAKITKNMSEKLTKMIPKWSQNLSKIDPGGVWRPLGSHPWNKVLPRPHFWWFWLQFGTPFGTSLGSCWASCFFCVFFWSGFLMALASIWVPKTPPKWDPKGCQNQNLKFIDFASIYNTLATFKGAENHYFSVFFWNPVLGGLWESIFMILAHFWGPCWRPLGSLFGYHFCIDF